MNAALVASIRQRLLNLAERTGIEYNRLLSLYTQERWLARLSNSADYSTRFILKGGLLLYSTFGLVARPTRDIDFLGRVSNSDGETIARIVRDISVIELPDGVEFDASSIKVEASQGHSNYGGFSVKLIGYLGTARLSINIDIGFGDALVEGPTRINYPSLLTDAGLDLLAYSNETVIAEKLHAGTILLDINSRYKDFWDIYSLASHVPFRLSALKSATIATFSRRQSSISNSMALFKSEFVDDPTRQLAWLRFLERIGRDEPRTFSMLMRALQIFLEPVVTESSAGQWDPDTWMWVS